MKIKKQITLTLFLVLLTTGCSLINPTYDITINAMTNSNKIVPPSSYIIKPMNKELDLNGLMFQKQSKLLHEILGEKGYEKAKSELLASLVIYLDYGIKKDHEEKEVYVDPELSFSGYGLVKPYEGIGYDPLHGGLSYYDNDFYKGTFRTYTTIYTYYDRYLTILAKDRLSKEVWRIDVSSIGESQDVKKIIPRLIEASKPFIGTKTEVPMVFEIKKK